MYNKFNENTNTRIDWIDLYRGILIFLVCLGHRNSTNKAVLQWLYSFHLPAFFFISGYLIKDKQYIDNLSVYAKKITVKMVIPYFSLGIIYVFLNILYRILFHRTIFLSDWVLTLLTTNQFQEGVNIGPLWFLHALIFVELISFYLHKTTKHALVSGTFLVVIGLIIIKYKKYLGFMMIDESFLLNIPTVLIGLFFYECGYSIKRTFCIWKSFFIHKWNRIIAAVCVIIINLIVSEKINDRVDLRYAMVGNSIFFLIGAVTGIICIYILVKCLLYIRPIKDFFVFYGRNTLTIMAFHYFPGFMILETISYKMLGIAYANNAISGRGEGLLYSILVLLLLTPLILLLNKFTPTIVGKKRISV